MNYMPKIDRRSFLVGTAAVGGGLSLGMQLPFGPDVVRAADGSPEVNAWVVIRPDDTVVIRVARAEMGQGSLTGLAQLVAEELDCDWSKVTWENPTPGQNVARKRVWGDYATVGSRAIRQSHEYVRKGGAAAREMLKQAAANEWQVPVAEVTASNSVLTHARSGRTTTYGKVAEAAAKLEPPADIKFKDPKDWKIAGKPLKRLDTPNKVTGKQVYTWLVPPDLPDGYLEVHTISVDSERNLYGGDNQYGRTQKFVAKKGADPALIIGPPWVAK